MNSCILVPKCGCLCMSCPGLVLLHQKWKKDAVLHTYRCYSVGEFAKPEVNLLLDQTSCSRTLQQLFIKNVCIHVKAGFLRINERSSSYSLLMCSEQWVGIKSIEADRTETAWACSWNRIKKAQICVFSHAVWQNTGPPSIQSICYSVASEEKYYYAQKMLIASEFCPFFTEQTLKRQKNTHPNCYPTSACFKSLFV